MVSCLGGLSLPPAPVFAADEGRVIASLDGDNILLGDVLHRMGQSRSPAHDPAAHGVPALVPEKTALEALEDVIRQRLIMHEAKARGVAAVTDEDFNRAFTASHMVLPDLSDRAFQEAWVASVLFERLIERALPALSAGKSEVDGRLKVLQPGFQPEVAIVHWIATATEGEARRVIERLDAGEPFAELAKVLSIEEASARAGGLVGSLRPDKAPPELARAIFSPTSTTGIVRDPIHVTKPVPFYGPAGWYVVRIDDLVRDGDGEVAPLRPVAEHLIKREKAVKVVEARLEKRRKSSTIWIIENFQALFEPAGPSVGAKPTR